MNYNEFPTESYLKAYRKLAGLTQKQLADSVGCNVYTIQLLESEKITPNLKLAYAICVILSNNLAYTVNPCNIFPSRYINKKK